MKKLCFTFLLMMAAVVGAAELEMINLTSPSGKGDTLPVGGAKINANFLEVQSRVVVVSNNTMAVGNALTNFNTNRFIQNKTIVLEGSSTMQGYAASTSDPNGIAYDTTNGQSFQQLFRSDMAYKGWYVTNFAIAGNGSANAMARFYTKTVPLNPRVVLYGMGMNELIGNANAGAYRNCMSNAMLYAELADQNKIKTVFTTQWLQTYLRDELYPYKLQYVNDLEASGYPYFDWMSSIDDRSGIGNPITNAVKGTNYDGLHYYNVGHTLLRDAIVSDYFLRPDKQASIKPLTGGVTIWPATPWIGGANTNEGMYYQFADYCPHAYTFAFWAKLETNAATQVRLLSVVDNVNVGNTSPANDFRLRVDAANTISLVNASSSAVTLSNIAPYDCLWHHYAFVHNDYYGGGTNYVYVDGTQRGSIGGNLLTSSNAYTFCFGGTRGGGNHITTSYRDVAIYRVSLTADKIYQLYIGNVPRGSLECFCPLSDNSFKAGQTLLNVMPVNNSVFVTTNQYSFVKTPVMPISGSNVVNIPLASLSTELQNTINQAVPSVSTPASASASGVAGQFAWDTNYVYICVASNIWKRASISTW